jgi:actin-like ATPase involved in cell morphogenesis
MAEPGELDQELARLQSRLEQMHGILPGRIEVNPDEVQQGLAKLVLTLIEFVRRVLERQAIRRMEGGTLTEGEIERMGLALMQLEEQLQTFKAQFGLTDEDLALNLGPLGELM